MNERVPFGRTGMMVSRLAVGSSYGVGGDDLVRAFDRGVNFMFWGLRRTRQFGEGLRRIAARGREGVVIGIQSYSRSAALMRPFVECALRRLKTDHVDLLTLGWWNDAPPRRILDAAIALEEAGKVRHLMVSSHHRPSLLSIAAEPAYGGIMLRYSAAHTGAEREVFPSLAAGGPGVLAFTATRWGTLLDPALTPAGDRTPTATDCYRFVLSNPSVHVSLCGPKDGAELDGALAALERGPMSDDELAWMRRVGANVRAKATKESPVNVLDRLISKVSPGPRASADSSSGGR